MYKFDSRWIGYPPIEAVVAAPASLNLLPIPAGVVALAEDPVWGPGEFIFARASGAIANRALCVFTPVWDATNRTFTRNMVAAPNTANLGRAVYVCMSDGGLADTQYGWFMRSGVSPINGTATVAADTAFGITAAGQVGAIAAGKQIVNGRIITPATQTVVKAMLSGVIGDTKVPVKNTDGWFVGGYIAGTGIPAGATIASIDPLGNFIILSAALTADPTGANATVTYNNAVVFYNVAHLDDAFAQGAIT